MQELNEDLKGKYYCPEMEKLFQGDQSYYLATYKKSFLFIFTAHSLFIAYISSLKL
jgi:hypothetical protein